MKIPQRASEFNKSYFGIAGKIGDGANAQIYYLQTTLKMKELIDIQLIQNLPGSEKWGIKSLFQRNVDEVRINGDDGLVKYFKNKNKIKYFNPITLVVLPIENKTPKTVITKLKEKLDEEFNDIKGISYTKENYFRLCRQKENDGSFGKIEWNSDNCDVVAVDGQHRLTALKKIHQDTKGKKEGSIDSWEIPVIFLIVSKKEASMKADNLIEIIRKIFVYINMKAVRINDKREIILNDESIECICVQEIISKFHENEISNEKNPSYPPLYLIDWIGDDKSHSFLSDKIYLFDNIELREWIKEYLIGKDFKPTAPKANEKQIKNLALTDIELDFFKNSNTLSSRDANEIRKQFNEDICPSFINFLISLEPIKNYISKCREYEASNSDGSCVHSWSELKFGHKTPDRLDREEIDKFKKSYIETLERFCDESINKFQKNLIFLRGIIFAYGELFHIYKDFINKSIDWSDYTELFLPAFNEIVSSKWCKHYEDLEPNEKKILTWICHNNVGSRHNYKISDVKKSWGIFVIMEILNFMKKESKFEGSDICMRDRWDDQYKDILQNTLENGFKNIAKSEADEKELNLVQRKEYIKTHKKLYANERIKELEEMWELVW